MKRFPTAGLEIFFAALCKKLLLNLNCAFVTYRNGVPNISISGTPHDQKNMEIIGSPHRTAAAMPAHRNGPKAIRVFRSAFFMNSSQLPYAAPKNTAIPSASKLYLHPRNAPQAAMSFISPPPKAPGTHNVSTRSKRLAEHMPNSRSGNPISGKRGMENRLTPNTASTSLSGIVLVFPSVHAAAVSTPKNRHSIAALPAGFHRCTNRSEFKIK